MSVQLLRMEIAFTQDGQWKQRTVYSADRAKITKRKDIVGTAPAFGMAQTLSEGQSLCCCKGKPFIQLCMQGCFKIRGGGFQQCSGGLQRDQVIVLCAKGKMGNKAESGEDFHAAQRKVLSIAHGKGAWQLQYQISPGAQGRLCPVTRLVNGRHASLGKAAAHQADDQRIRQLPADQVKLVRVPLMKRIVFADNTDNRSHRIALQA